MSTAGPTSPGSGLVPPAPGAGGPVRVLVVDDSPTVRAVLRRMLGRDPGLQVVGEAGDGGEAVQMAGLLRPDVVLMDLEMPGIDGFAAIQQIVERAPTPILVLSSRMRLGGRRTVFEALQAGAAEVLAKPESPDDWGTLTSRLPETLRSLARGAAAAPPDGGVAAAADRAVEVPALAEVAVAAPAVRGYLRVRPEILAVGASTGGPQALQSLLEGLRPARRLAVLVVQHIAPEFQGGLADWLRQVVGTDVRLAQQGETPPAGAVRLAPQGSHLRLRADGTVQLDASTPARRGHRPSADELFLSCARWGSRAAGVLLSGMGRDGVEGLLAMRQAGSATLVQDEASSVVFGMPRAALEVGAADRALPPAALARHLVALCEGEPPPPPEPGGTER
jgi:two-component system chemotaxis response regulator CheB